MDHVCVTKVTAFHSQGPTYEQLAAETFGIAKTMIRRMLACMCLGISDVVMHGAPASMEFRCAAHSTHSSLRTTQHAHLCLPLHTAHMQELLMQTGHYSEKARRHALLGMSDLFQRHPEEMRQHAHQFFPKVAERVGDPDQAVRQALRALLRERVMPLVDGAALRPFMPVIMAHVCG